jgi:hypothetical protein
MQCGDANLHKHLLGGDAWVSAENRATLQICRNDSRSRKLVMCGTNQLLEEVVSIRIVAGRRPPRLPLARSRQGQFAWRLRVVLHPGHDLCVMHLRNADLRRRIQ